MKRVSKSFMKFFLSFTAVLIVPFLFLLIMQTIMAKNIMEENAVACQNNIAYAAESISSVLEDVQALSESILRDREMQSFIRTSMVTRQAISDIYTWKDLLMNYSHVNSDVKDIFLYSFANNWIICASSSSSTSSAVAMNSIMYSASLGFKTLSYTEWQQQIHGELLNGFYLLGDDELFHLTKYRSSLNQNALLMIRLDTSSMRDSLLSILANGGSAYLLDESGRLILAAGDLHFSNGKEDEWLKAYLADLEPLPNGYVAFSGSAAFGWQLISILPAVALHENAQRFSLLTLRMTILVFFIDILLCLFLSTNNARPLRRITASISSQIPREYLDNRDEYILIENSIAVLLEKNSSYRTITDEQRELINSELVRCLLQGEYSNPEYFERLSSYSSIPLKDRKFGVITVLNEGISPNGFETGIIQGVLKNYETQVLSFQDRYVILFSLAQNTDNEAWNRLSHLFCLEINKTSRKEKYRMCISSLCSSTTQIHSAYDETVAMVEIVRVDPEGTAKEFHFAEVVQSLSDTFYDYPIDMELQIIHALKMGNSGMMTDLLTEVRLRNYTDRKLSAYMTRQLIYEIRGTVIRGLQPYLTDQRIKDHIRSMCAEATLDTLFQHIEDLCTEMPDILRSENDRHDDQLEEVIYTYLSENYTNANLSLENLVEPLGLSERYLYDFIRDHMSSTFSKLLEGLRITKACTLLREEKATVKTVAAQVGYNSDHTFRLAFKRVMDVTPSEYASAYARHKS